jgi:quinol monooxygenase YgiN
MTVSVFASFHPHLESVAKFLDLMAGMVRDTRNEPGCLRYDLFAEAGEGTGYHLFEIYADSNALEAHRAAGHYKAYRAAVPDLLAEPIGVLVLEAVDAES